MTKAVYVLLDGVGDKPDPALNHLTPLEAAQTPTLDQLTRNGRQGIVYPLGRKVSPESDIAVFSMLGYELGKAYPGRGVIEALGSEVDFKEGYLALRANFATADEGGRILDRRAGRDLTSGEGKELADGITKKVRLSYGAEFVLRSTIGHRGVLVVKLPSKALSSNITNTDPAYERVGSLGLARTNVKILRVSDAKPLDKKAASKMAAALVNEFTRKACEVLNNHPANRRRRTQGKKPANVILLRDAGHTFPKVARLDQKFGLRFGCLVEMPVEKGIANVTGMLRREVKAGYAETAKEVANLLKEVDIVYVHIKGPDEPGHDGDSRMKTRIIEEISEQFFGKLCKEIAGEKVLIAISADHSTPCILKSHSADPVPLLISGPGVKRDRTCRFTEREARNGALGTLKGSEVLPMICNLLRG